MVDYYKLLGVKSTATAAEIKSAYRRLARKRHPDVNGGSTQAARDFAMLALAYRTLSDPQERAYYDAQQMRIRNGVSASSSSVLHSDNPHARRMRRVVAAQRRLDKVVDTWIEEGRRETFALQQAVFPTVTLFLSTFFVIMLKPKFWEGFGWAGRGILITLFLIGVWHLTSRLRTSLERYTYRPKSIHTSLMEDEEKPDKPFSRLTAYAFLIAAFMASLGAGYVMGEHMHYVILDNMPFFFSHDVKPHLLFYPPIAVLIVDTMHSVASKID
ncbi:MAG TPA: J domain-containing protein [Pyrinomonadaceae bacterium]|nr:J domain-containing protein [Pyrinomonadaceae bacterium]